MIVKYTGETGIKNWDFKTGWRFEFEFDFGNVFYFRFYGPQNSH